LLLDLFILILQLHLKTFEYVVILRGSRQEFTSPHRSIGRQTLRHLSESSSFPQKPVGPKPLVHSHNTYHECLSGTQPEHKAIQNPPLFYSCDFLTLKLDDKQTKNTITVPQTFASAQTNLNPAHLIDTPTYWYPTYSDVTLITVETSW
jgi:hypothetical protein